MTVVNDAPVASSFQIDMQEDGTLKIAEAELLLSVTDDEGDALTITNVKVGGAALPSSPARAGDRGGAGRPRARATRIAEDWISELQRG